jgi:hypothetical protein
MLAVVKQLLSVAWSIGVLIAFVIVLFSAIKIYKRFRKG